MVTKADEDAGAAVPPAAPYVVSLRVARLQSATALTTLAKWRSLPLVIHLEELAALLALTLDQDREALRRILAHAAAAGEIRRWWLSPSNRWEEFTGQDMPRGAQEGVRLGSVGTAPVDAVALLRKRGVDVPQALLDLLGAPAPGTAWWRSEHDIHAMAEAAGTTLHEEGKKTRNEDVARLLEKRIFEAERADAGRRRTAARACPSWGTLRKELNGWKFGAG